MLCTHRIYSLSRLCFVATYMYTHTTAASIEDIDICGNNDNLHVTNRFFGSIRHFNESSSSEVCALTIPKPSGNAHDYVVIEGLTAMQTNEPCTQKQVTVMSVDYCVAASPGFIVIKLHQENYLNISTWRNTLPFKVTYYFTGMSDRG